MIEQFVELTNVDLLRQLTIYLQSGPLPVLNGVIINPYKWPYKWVTGVVTGLPISLHLQLLGGPLWGFTWNLLGFTDLLDLCGQRTC